MRDEARAFKALSDETRLRILALLVEGECCVADLMAALQLPQSTVSRHLATLKHAGLIEDRRERVFIYYRLAQLGNSLERDLLFLVEKRIRMTDVVQDDLRRLRQPR